MGVFARWVDSFWSKVPVWLQTPNGRKYLTPMVVFYDIATDVFRQGTHASLPGAGTPTALDFIGQMHGMIRGDGESDDSYAARLPEWRDRARTWGSQYAIARALHEYVKGNPKVRVVNRNGIMVTCDVDGTMTTQNVTWDWDSLSNPERNDPNAPWWAELWIIIYSPPWAETGPTLISPGSPPSVVPIGIGMKVPPLNVDVVKRQIEQYKSDHSFVRCVIWTYDSTLFNPANPLTMPDGTWGQWSYPTKTNGARHRSGRSLSCRYWEPERHPQPY